MKSSISVVTKRTFKEAPLKYLLCCYARTGPTS
jgi:hypothetical protein